MLFREQVLLAKELGLPVIIHDREAHADTLEVLRELRPAGVLHCFSGSAEMAGEVAALGMYIGFTGAITFKNARKAPQAAAAVPDDLLLIETDCPYMAPEPYRGKRCDSSMLPRVAERLAELGWQSFVVNYRVRPYTMEEGSLDLARAIRYVRSHAGQYGIDPDRIASVGFSAGGILCGDEALHFDGQVNGTALDDSYVPDALDDVSADVCAIGMIYSFYGRLSVSNNNVDDLRAGNIPPTFYTYGTEDPFYRQFIANANAAREAGVQVEEHVLDGWPHGFGVQGEWTTWFDSFLTQIMSH